MEKGRARAARQFIAALPFARALGLRLGAIDAGGVEVEMPWDARLVGDPATGVLHGGAVSALLDTALGAAVLAHPDAPAGTATLDLRVDYLRAARPGAAVRARAECHHRTRSVAFVRATASDGEGAFATAVACFTVEGGR